MWLVGFNFVVRFAAFTSTTLIYVGFAKMTLSMAMHPYYHEWLTTVGASCIERFLFVICLFHFFNKNHMSISRILSFVFTKVLPFICDAGHPSSLAPNPPISSEQLSITGIHGLSTRQVYPKSMLP